MLSALRRWTFLLTLDWKLIVVTLQRVIVNVAPIYFVRCYVVIQFTDSIRKVRKKNRDNLKIPLRIGAIVEVALRSSVLMSFNSIDQIQLAIIKYANIGEMFMVFVLVETDWVMALTTVALKTERALAAIGNTISMSIINYVGATSFPRLLSIHWSSGQRIPHYRIYYKLAFMIVKLMLTFRRN